MTEYGGVKINAEAVFLCKLYPRSKMAIFKFIAVYPFSIAENGVTGVQIYALFAGNMRSRL